ncbi:MAG: CDP-diacylglycerol--serine O-phosphatidyltransferase [Deltaproteobacteria bacterium]|nr:MAG: CDP-diacylglycerol--serine O-phosphatidyltransferase [Deltaproteobacteria bacterium]
MFVLPNLFTISGIFCGFFAVTLASGPPGPGKLYRATLAIFFGIFFDMADGRVARLTKTQSDFGVQLDSLADVMTFGMAPAIVVHKWGLSRLGLWGTLIAFGYVACGAIRLARFNVLAARQVPEAGKWFTGLPIPLAAGVLMSLVMFHQKTFANPPAVRQAHVVIVVLVLCYLMVSNVRYRTFKEVKVSAKSLTGFVLLLLLFTCLALSVQPTFALLCLFSSYVVLGLLEEVIFFRRRRREATAGGTGGGPLPPAAS